MAKSATVLITGVTGFLGGFLAEHYTLGGWQVHGTFKDRRDWRPTVLNGVEAHGIDLLDANATRRLLASTRPQLIHHLAAQSSVTQSWTDPQATLMGNIGAQLNVLQAACAEVPYARVVVVGSCDEYGDVSPSDNPIDETHQLRPTSPYALSKVAQDLMGFQYAIAREMAVVRVRPFLQLGPRRSDLFVAGSFARQIAEIEWGCRRPVIEVGNIDLVRDFTDVRDVARAYARIAEEGVAGDVYNICSGIGHTLRELLDVMMTSAGVRAEIEQGKSRHRPGEPDVMIGDPSRLRSSTKWEPTISFEASAVDTLRYWRDCVGRTKGASS